jgi:hypothetical protein
VNQGKRRLNQSLRFVRAAPPTNTGEFGVVALLDERDNLNRPRTSSLELSELLKRWGRGGRSARSLYGCSSCRIAPGVGGDVVDGVGRYLRGVDDRMSELLLLRKFYGRDRPLSVVAFNKDS